MDLNIKLPQHLRQKLMQHSRLETIYCIKNDINLNGEFAPNLYIGATEKEVFIFEGETEKYIPINTCQTAACHNMVNGGVLSLTINGEETMIARCSMTNISRIACLAKGIKLLCEGNTEKRVINRDKEKYCLKCGRVLPGTVHCPKCDKEHRNFSRLLNICKPHSAALTVIIALMLLGSAIDLSVQFVLRYFVDGYLLTGKGTAISVLLI